MRKWFDKYDRNITSVTNNGEQTHVNYEIQNWGKVQWLKYEYQAIWNYEMAINYPFLYTKENRDNATMISNCIEACLLKNHFLHFAGSWYESEMWKADGITKKTSADLELSEYS